MESAFPYIIKILSSIQAEGILYKESLISKTKRASDIEGLFRT